MTNFENYLNNLTQEQFIDNMILNCDGCPAYPCKEDVTESTDGMECEYNLRKWCEELI